MAEISNELYSKAKDFAKKRRRHRTKTAATVLGSAGIGALGGDATSFIDRMLPEAQANNDSVLERAQGAKILMGQLQDLAKLKAAGPTKLLELSKAKDKAFSTALTNYMSYKGTSMTANARVAGSKNEALQSALNTAHKTLVDAAKMSLAGSGGVGAKIKLQELLNNLGGVGQGAKGQTNKANTLAQREELLEQAAILAGPEGIAAVYSDIERIEGYNPDPDRLPVKEVLAGLAQKRPELSTMLTKGLKLYNGAMDEVVVNAARVDETILADLVGGVRVERGEKAGQEFMAFWNALETDDFETATKLAGDVSAAMDPVLTRSGAAGDDLLEELAMKPEGDLTMQGLKDQLMNTDAFKEFMREGVEGGFADEQVAFRTLMQIQRDRRRKNKREDNKKGQEVRAAATHPEGYQGGPMDAEVLGVDKDRAMGAAQVTITPVEGSTTPGTAALESSLARRTKEARNKLLNDMDKPNSGQTGYSPRPSR